MENTYTSFKALDSNVITGIPEIDIKTYQFHGRIVNLLIINGDVWFLGCDIANILDYSDMLTMTRMLDVYEKSLYTVSCEDKITDAVILHRSSIQKLIWNSSLPDYMLREFDYWIKTIINDAVSCSTNTQQCNNLKIQNYSLDNNSNNMYDNGKNMELDTFAIMFWMYKHGYAFIHTSSNGSKFLPTKNSIDLGLLAMKSGDMVVTPKGVNFFINEIRRTTM